MCQRTLRVAVGAGDGCVFFCQVICEFPLPPAIFLSPTQICYWLFCSYLLPSALLLHRAPYVTVVSIARSGNYTKKKLKGKKRIFGNLPPTAATLPAASFGFTTWEFPRGGGKSQFIQKHWQLLRPSNQPAGLAGLGEIPPPGKRFPVPAPQGGGRASLQALMPHAALQLEVSLRFCCCPRGSSEATCPRRLGVPAGTMVWLTRDTRNSWSRMWHKQAASSKEDACGPSCRKYLEDIWQPQKC